MKLEDIVTKLKSLVDKNTSDISTNKSNISAVASEISGAKTVKTKTVSANTGSSGSFSVTMNPGEIVIGVIGAYDAMCSLRAYWPDTNRYEFNYAILTSSMIYQRDFNSDVTFTVYYITI